MFLFHLNVVTIPARATWKLCHIFHFAVDASHVWSDQIGVWGATSRGGWLAHGAAHRPQNGLQDTVLHRPIGEPQLDVMVNCSEFSKIDALPSSNPA